jgi:uncharacterized protein YacL
MLEIIQTLLLIIIIIFLARQVITRPQKQTDKPQLVIDTCALIDARIVDIARAGFTVEQLVIPKFIVAELQMLADGNDSHKRERARVGLDVVNSLKELSNIKVSISERNYSDIKTTDDKLVKLSSELGADLCTTDYNLNKVATIHGVRVLNVNELANAVRPVALPGEKKQIKIVQKGSNKDQGVGYLVDGTMVVVAGAGNMIGKQVTVEVTRMLQTDAGKMLFAKRSITNRSR